MSFVCYQRPPTAQEDPCYCMLQGLYICCLRKWYCSFQKDWSGTEIAAVLPLPKLLLSVRHIAPLAVQNHSLLEALFIFFIIIKYSRCAIIMWNYDFGIMLIIYELTKGDPYLTIYTHQLLHGQTLNVCFPHSFSIRWLLGVDMKKRSTCYTYLENMF